MFGDNWAFCRSCGDVLVTTFEFPHKEWICMGCGAIVAFLSVAYRTPTEADRERHEVNKATYAIERAQRKEAADAGR